MAVTAIRSSSHLKKNCRRLERISRQINNTDVRRMIRRPQFCRLRRSRPSFPITLGNLWLPSLFLRLTLPSISPETWPIAPAISDRRHGDRYSQSSEFNPAFNSRFAGEGRRAPFIERHRRITARVGARNTRSTASITHAGGEYPPLRAR
jgi:hypothetical protein